MSGHGFDNQATLAIEHVELTLTPHSEDATVLLDVTQMPEQERGLAASVVFTPDGARGLAAALRKVAGVVGKGEDGPNAITSDEFTTCVVNPVHDCPALTVAVTTPALPRPRGACATLSFDLVAAEAEQLAELLDQTAMLAYSVGGVA